MGKTKTKLSLIYLPTVWWTTIVLLYGSSKVCVGDGKGTPNYWIRIEHFQQTNADKRIQIPKIILLGNKNNATDP